MAPQFGNTYGPGHVVDENLRTAWVEGKPGHGEGEYLIVDLGRPHTVSGVQIMNGYHKNARLFRANSRVKRATLVFSSGIRRSIMLRDAPGIQTIAFPPVEARWVQFQISSVFGGKKYKDTAVTEFRVLTASGG
ncbi:MAG: discoidin domain-containing protein [Hyphomicrobiaceae bacterium]